MMDMQSSLKVVDILVTKTGDEELDRFFKVANSLHINFYEGWMSPGQAIRGSNDVEKLIQKLRKFLDDKK